MKNCIKQLITPIESLDSKISFLSDGSVSIKFDHSHLNIDKTKSFSSISIIQVPIQYPNSLNEQLGAYDEQTDHFEDIIAHFNSQGEKVFHCQDLFSSHICFDICDVMTVGLTVGKIMGLFGK